MLESESHEQQNLRLVDKIFSAAQASAVFSAPVIAVFPSPIPSILAMAAAVIL